MNTSTGIHSIIIKSITSKGYGVNQDFFEIAGSRGFNPNETTGRQSGNNFDQLKRGVGNTK